jgi:hypothetical protein
MALMGMLMTHFSQIATDHANIPLRQSEAGPALQARRLHAAAFGGYRRPRCASRPCVLGRVANGGDAVYES